jgi:hypothetical protein
LYDITEYSIIQAVCARIISACQFYINSGICELCFHPLSAPYWPVRGEVWSACRRCGQTVPFFCAWWSVSVVGVEVCSSGHVAMCIAQPVISYDRFLCWDLIITAACWNCSHSKICHRDEVKHVKFILYFKPCTAPFGIHHHFSDRWYSCTICSIMYLSKSSMSVFSFSFNHIIQGLWNAGLMLCILLIST